MKPRILQILVAVVGLFVLWLVYWSGYQSGYVKVKEEQYSSIYLSAAEKLHFLKALGTESNSQLRNDIRLSIKENVTELESLDTYLHTFDGFRLWDRFYEVPMLAYLSSKLHSEDQDRKSMLAALKNEAAKIENGSREGTK